MKDLKMSQLKIIICVGACGSGKSTWCKEFINLNPSYLRVNNDDLRSMLHNSIYSPENEKMIKKMRSFIISESLNKNLNILVDNINASQSNWEEICAIAKKSNKDVIITEKLFYEDLEVLLDRNSKRVGNAKVGDMVVKKFWKQLGGKQFAHRKARVQTFAKAYNTNVVTPMIQDEKLKPCIIADLDGTMCNISHRNPYDASTCNKDLPNQHVVELCRLFYTNNYKIFFFSGREDKHRDMTVEWLNYNFGGNYELHMRETGNFEDDRKLKERFFNSFIKDKFNCKAWVDDRLRVAEFVYQAGLPLFRVGDPAASF